MKKLTTGQVARALQVSGNTVLRLIYNGQLKAERLTDNSQYRVTIEELHRFAENRGIALLPDNNSKK